jgi:hypothetical protein
MLVPKIPEVFILAPVKVRWHWLVVAIALVTLSVL